MRRKWKLRSVLLKALKIAAWITASIIITVAALALIIQIPSVQNKLAQKAVSFLNNKIGTRVSLEHISLSFPKRIVIDGIYLEDQSRDTLFSAAELSVNTNLWGLIRNRIHLDDIRLNGFHAHMNRSQKDSSFNFQYIIDAFAGDTIQASDTDTTKQGWKFSLGGIDLTDGHFTYQDHLEENYIDVRLGQFGISLDDFDLDKRRFKVNSITLQDINAQVIQEKDNANQTTTASSARPPEAPFDFSVNTVKAHSVSARYRNKAAAQLVYVDLGDLLITANKIDLGSREINLDEINLSNSFISFQQASDEEDSVSTKAKAIETSASSGEPWQIRLDNLNISNNGFQYRKLYTPAKPRGIDFSNLWFTGLSTSAENLVYHGNQIKGTITKLSLLDRSGFGIKSFSADFNLNDTSASVKRFSLQTPDSRVNFNASVKFDSLETISKSYPEAVVNLDIRESFISFRDVLQFSPSLSDHPGFDFPKNEKVEIDASVAGPVRHLTVARLDVKTLRDTHLKGSGTIKGLPSEDAIVDFSLDNFYTTLPDITSVVADTLIPAAISLPQWINVSGRFSGTIRSPAIAADINTSLGSLNLQGALSSTGRARVPGYTAELNVKDFQLGKLLKQETIIGLFEMRATIEGQGFTRDELDTRINLDVPLLQYQGYTYRDLHMSGSLRQTLFSVNASLDDKNLAFRLEGNLNYNDSIPRYYLALDLKNADLKELNLSQRPLKARGTVDVNLRTSDFKSINGTFDIRNVAIYNGNELYTVDSLFFAAIDREGESSLTVRSDVVSGDFNGNINLFSIPGVLSRHFRYYYQRGDTTLKINVPSQQFNFSLVLKNTDLLTKIILPDLERFVPGRMEGNFNSAEHRLDVRFELARLRYSGVSVDTVKINVTSDEHSLNYTLGVRKIRMDSLHVEAIQTTGKIANDSAYTRLAILDSLLRDKYVVAGAFYSLKEVFRFHLLRDQVINYAPWNAPSDNFLQLGPQGIVAHDFSLTNINESITFITKNGENSTAALVFKDLNLQNVVNLVEGTVLADGLVNGAYNIAGKGAFNSNLEIQNFKILNQSWGDIDLHVSRATNGPYNFDFRLTGEQAEIAVGGYYTSSPANPDISVNARFSKLNLSAMAPFTRGQLKDAEGTLFGEVTIHGHPSRPAVRGSLTFRNASFTPTFANSRFVLENEVISFTNEGVFLQDFKILDNKNNTAILKGLIRTHDYADFELDLSLSAKNFQVINTTEGENDLFYGTVNVNTTARISGNITQPKIQMEVSLDGKSELTYIVPQSEKGVLEQKGIVVFVDRDAEKDPFLAGITARDTIKSTFTGFDLTANIELDDKEKLSIIIDPVTGDKLSVKGNSTLTLDIDPTGDVQLSGRYEITEGSYDLTFYKLVKRNFSIEKGSTITWAGDPLDATMDIRASFKVETSPMELVSNQLTTSSTQELNMYRQRLPFLVYLNIKGNLLTPEISFELDMPLDKRNALDGSVYARIKDINTRESDLNKQVFALLILRRFITDDPFDNQSGGAIETTARRSVSKLLSEQLNRLSENVKGIELSFDVKSYDDYSTGAAKGQTEVQLGVSKSLLDDRLIVKVSGNVDIEGNTNNQNSFGDYIGDLALEYKLTEDGRFRITGFRNSNYDIISGELIETGAGLIYIKDYNTLRELFKANAKDK